MYSTLKITTKFGETLFVIPKYISAIEHNGSDWYLSIVGRRYPVSITEATAAAIVQTIGQGCVINPPPNEPEVQAASLARMSGYFKVNE